MSARRWLAQTPRRQELVEISQQRSTVQAFPTGRQSTRREIDETSNAYLLIAVSRATLVVRKKPTNLPGCDLFSI